MKALPLLFGSLLTIFTISAAQKPIPHGMVYGTKPSKIAMLDAARVEAFMGKKTRISTTIRGKVLRVTKTKGGWFDIDAGHGKIIAAHFKVYNITIPIELKGHYVIAEGVAARQFTADDSQHLAGGDKQHGAKIDPNQKITLEVTGLMVD